MQASGLVVGAGVVLGAVGIRVLAPVGQGGAELLVAQARGLLHQQRLVAPEARLARRRAGLGQGRHVGGVDVTRQPGRLGMGHVPQRAAQAQPAAGDRHRHAGPRRQPRRRAAGAVGLPGAARVEGGRGPRGRRLQAIELAMQRQDRLAVGEARRIGRTHRVDRAPQLLEHVHRLSARRHCAPHHVVQTAGAPD